MTRLALVGGSAMRSVPVELRGEDRLHPLAAPMRSLSWLMVAVALASLAIHVVLMAIAVVAAREPIAIPSQREIAVEVVPAPPNDSVQKVPAPKPAPAPPIKMDRARPDQAKPAQSAANPDEAKALRDELAKLRAEEAALTAKANAMEASGKALALPTIGGTDGDAIGYHQLVFSQLAKAKGDGEYRGRAGVTAVRFEIDPTGQLARVDIVRSSGSATLDNQALDIVRRAAPFPPPPTVADRTVFANVNFVPADD